MSKCHHRALGCRGCLKSERQDPGEAGHRTVEGTDLDGFPSTRVRVMVPEIMYPIEVLIGCGVVNPFNVEKDRRSGAHQAGLQRGIEVEPVGLEACEPSESVHLGMGHEVPAECLGFGRRFVDTIATGGHYRCRLGVHEDCPDAEAPSAIGGPCFIEGTLPGRWQCIPCISGRQHPTMMPAPAASNGAATTPPGRRSHHSSAALLATRQRAAKSPRAQV